MNSKKRWIGHGGVEILGNAVQGVAQSVSQVLMGVAGARPLGLLAGVFIGRFAGTMSMSRCSFVNKGPPFGNSDARTSDWHGKEQTLLVSIHEFVTYQYRWNHRAHPCNGRDVRRSCRGFPRHGHEGDRTSSYNGRSRGRASLPCRGGGA